MPLTLKKKYDFVHVHNEKFFSLPSLSFDYAIMEHTQKAAVVALDCGWSDVGTWDAAWQLAPKDANGNTSQGDTFISESKNCYLSASDSMHISALGVEDLLIIATKDSVLVANMSCAQAVKALVTNLRITHMHLLENGAKTYRPWGYYESIQATSQHQIKRLIIHPKAKLSLQMHQRRAEHWFIINGVAQVTLGTELHELHANESIYIPQGTYHRLENLSDTPLEVLEVQTGSYLGEDDIIRIEDAYGRK